MYQSGDIIVVNLPYTDLSTSKVRPTFVVTKLRGNDLIVCQISSQPPRSYEVAVEIKDSDLEEGHLRFDSYVRIDKIFTIDQRIVLTKLGHVNQNKLQEVKQAIIALLG